MGFDPTAPLAEQFKQDLKAQIQSRVLDDPANRQAAREVVNEQIQRGNIAAPVQPPAAMTPPPQAQPQPKLTAKNENDRDDGIFSFFTDPIGFIRGN